MHYVTAQLAKLRAHLRFITLDGKYVCAKAGDSVWIAYDPAHNEYTVNIGGLNFDIMPDEFSYLL